MPALRRRAFARHVHGEHGHLVTFQRHLAVELADLHRRLAAVDEHHDAIIAIVAKFCLGAQHIHRAVRDGVGRADLNPAQLQDRHFAMKLPAGDDSHFERRADGVHRLRP